MAGFHREFNLEVELREAFADPTFDARANVCGKDDGHLTFLRRPHKAVPSSPELVGASACVTVRQRPSCLCVSERQAASVQVTMLDSPTRLVLTADHE